MTPLGWAWAVGLWHAGSEGPGLDVLAGKGRGGQQDMDKILGCGNPARMSSRPSLLGASIGT